MKKKQPLPNSLKELPVISQQQIDELRESGHVVFIYPRKQIVRVDGFKRYRLASLF